MTKRVLICGSGPGVVATRNWNLDKFDCVVAINNAWRACARWDVLIHPDDFPPENAPGDLSAGQRIVRSDVYVPAQNLYGGVVMAGGTMAFTASYWVLADLRPDVVAYIGCDMVYPSSGKTHFYGKGTADPLRDDPTLQSLEAKSRRLEAIAAGQGCALVNLSAGESRLTFPRVSLTTCLGPALKPRRFEAREVKSLRIAEQALGYGFEDGRYWDRIDLIDWDALRRIDAGWLSLAEAGTVQASG